MCTDFMWRYDRRVGLISDPHRWAPHMGERHITIPVLTLMQPLRSPSQDE